MHRSAAPDEAISEVELLIMEIQLFELLPLSNSELANAENSGSEG